MDDLKIILNNLGELLKKLTRAQKGENVPIFEIGKIEDLGNYRSVSFITHGTKSSNRFSSNMFVERHATIERSQH